MADFKESERQRSELMHAYAGEKWATKVKKMSPSQVTAVYLRLKAQDKVK